MTALLLMAALAGAQVPRIHYDPKELLLPENTCYEVRVFSIKGDITQETDYEPAILGLAQRTLGDFASHSCHYAQTQRDVGDSLLYRLEAKLYLLDAQTVSKIQLDIVDQKSKNTLLSLIKKVPADKAIPVSGWANMRQTLHLAVIQALQKLCMARTCP